MFREAGIIEMEKLDGQVKGLVNSRLKRMDKLYRHMPTAGQPLSIGRVTEGGKDTGEEEI